MAVDSAYDVARNFSHSVAMSILVRGLMSIPKERLTISDIGRADKEMASLLIANAIIQKSKNISA
jgi:hypothetical protein